VLIRKNQLLLRFLKVRVVVNGSHIYYLDKKKPVVIPVSGKSPKLVASDGFHHTRPMQLVNRKKNTHYFKVGCVIEDDQLVAGLIILAIVFLMGLTSDILFIKILSFVPVIYFLYRYYINRREFLQIRSTD
jgi:hypothetical protein